ncbi:hypothetical protein U9M48_013955 [Paspalum notatum var. saurae]|uniref:Uncharacterized protein n=1 Tax=Paspalum notatum var. saurae TaxID=547442 RepID=A0AAQ3T1J6_PASNO
MGKVSPDYGRGLAYYVHVRINLTFINAGEAAADELGAVVAGQSVKSSTAGEAAVNEAGAAPGPHGVILRRA